MLQTACDRKESSVCIDRKVEVRTAAEARDWLAVAYPWPAKLSGRKPRADSLPTLFASACALGAKDGFRPRLCKNSGDAIFNATIYLDPASQ
jgi:hypothetical protein